MAAVPGFRHDVFVSYAHSDNELVAGTGTGFVSQLVADLQTEIGRKVGKALDIWWDQHKLAGNTPITGEIVEAAHGCASIVVVASPAYLRSEWCNRERNAFFTLLNQTQSGQPRAVFIVALEPIEQNKLPEDLRELRGYPFYRTLEDGRTTRPFRTDFTLDKQPYYDRLCQLAQNISDHLEALLAKAGTNGNHPLPPLLPDDSKNCVLLMEVTDDLVQRRAELRAYLEQSGIVVLPQKRYPRDDVDKHREQMLADLRRSRACVQILGPLAGDRSDHPKGLSWFRYETIRDAGCPVPFLQWRDPDLDLGSIADPDALELITPASVRTDRVPDFRRAVAELALKQPEKQLPRVQQDMLSVFVNSDLLDRQLATELASSLEAQGFLVLEPPKTTEDAREEWETNLRYCDSLLLVYGQTKPGWVKTQILLSNKIHREDPMDLLCVCVGPPIPDPAHDKATDLALRSSSIYYMRIPDAQQPDRTELERFASKLREAHAHA